MDITKRIQHSTNAWYKQITKHSPVNFKLASLSTIAKLLTIAFGHHVKLSIDNKCNYLYPFVIDKLQKINL